MPGEQYLPPLQSVRKKYWLLRRALSAEGEDRGALQGVAVLVGVGRDRGHAGQAVVEDGYVVAELLAEGQDEAAQAAVDVEADPLLEGQFAERGDGVDRAVAVVAGRADDGHRLVVDVVGHPVHVDQGGQRVHRGVAELDAEEVAGLVEGRVGRLGLDDVRAGDGALLAGVLAVGQHGVGDAARPPGGDQAGREASLDGLAVEEVEGHGDDLGLELGRLGHMSRWRELTWAKRPKASVRKA